MKKLLLEIGNEFGNVIFGNVYNKTGLGLMFLFVDLIFIVVPIENEELKPKWLFIVGGFLILISVLFIGKRYFELNKISKKQTDNFD